MQIIYLYTVFRLTASNFAISATDISEFSLKAKKFCSFISRQDPDYEDLVVEGQLVFAQAFCMYCESHAIVKESNFAISATDISEFSLKAKKFCSFSVHFSHNLANRSPVARSSKSLSSFAHNISSVAGKLHCLCLRRIA